jgi:predicted site-specific integrase-resolvase
VKVSTMEAAQLLGIDISTLRQLMRLGKIAAPPILFDRQSSAEGRMWSEADIEAARVVLKAGDSSSN